MMNSARTAIVCGIAISLSLLLWAGPVMATTSGFTQISCGGSAVGTYVADTDFSGGTAKPRTNLIDIVNVPNPAPMAVYQNQRFGNFTYTLPGFTANSTNLVRLHFADTHWTTTGQRSFNVSINGNQVLTNFDIVAQAGAGNRALVKSFNVNASSSGNYVIVFTTVKDDATISGIEVLSISTKMKGNWLQFGGDAAHTGVNLMETDIGPSNITSLAPVSGWTTLPTSQSPPVLLTNVPSYGDIAFVNNAGKLVGVSPTTGAVVWQAPTPSGNTSSGEASPAIDPNLRTIYNIGSDGCVHKYDIATKLEYVGTGGGTLSSNTPTCSSNPTNGWPLTWGGQYAKTSLTIGMVAASTTKFLYLATDNGNGSYGSTIAINITDDSTNGGLNESYGMAGSWARAGLTFDLFTQRLFVPTVDGPFQPPYDWGFSVVGFNPDASGPADSFTPNPILGNDWDLGSTNMLVLPLSVSAPPPAQYTHLGLQSGKDGHLRLINLTNMSGQNGPGNLGTTDTILAGDTLTLPTLPDPPQCAETGGPCPVTSPISAWYDTAKDTTFMYVNSPMGLNVMQLVVDSAHGRVSMQKAWTVPTSQIVAGGTSVANGVLYYANTNGLFACNAEGPASSCFKVGPGSKTHQTPLVINGTLYYNGAAYRTPHNFTTWQVNGPNVFPIVGSMAIYVQRPRQVTTLFQSSALNIDSTTMTSPGVFTSWGVINTATGTVAAGPAAVSWLGPGGITAQANSFVAYIDNNHQVRVGFNSYNNGCGGCYSWTTLPGTDNSLVPPALAYVSAGSNTGGRVFLFTLSSTNQQARFQSIDVSTNGPTGNWTGVTNIPSLVNISGGLGAAGFSSDSLLVTASGGGGSTDCFYATLTSSGQTISQSGLKKLPSCSIINGTTMSVASMGGGNQAQGAMVVVTGTDGYLHISSTTDGVNFGAWTGASETGCGNPSPSVPVGVTYSDTIDQLGYTIAAMCPSGSLLIPEFTDMSY